MINSKNDLVYISRSVIPGFKSKYHTDKINYNKQVCIYGFSMYELEQFHNFGKKSLLEDIEDIEILRFKELDIKIKMFKCNQGSIAVDIPTDVERVEDKMRKQFK